MRLAKNQEEATLLMGPMASEEPTCRPFGVVIDTDTGKVTEIQPYTDVVLEGDELAIVRDRQGGWWELYTKDGRKLVQWQL